MKRNKRGITLIALIITIIVMLILVGVTINLSANGGLFNKTREGSKETEKWAIYDQIVSATHLTNDGKISIKETFESFKKNFGENKVEKDEEKSSNSKIVFTVQGNRGTYTYTITEEKIIVGIEEVEETDDYAILKRYFLGANGEGRKYHDSDEIFAITSNNEYKLLDIDETEVDESSLEVLIYPIYLWDEVVIASLKYNNTIYGIYIKEYVDKEDEGNPDKNYYFISDVKKMYTQISDIEGNDLGEVTGDSQYNGWTILYDYGSYVEAVSPTSMGSVHLGSDTRAYGNSAEANIEYDKAIDSYDNAIETINNCCKSLSGLPTNSGVRSVGAENDNTTDYYDLDPAKNNWANDRGFEIVDRGKKPDKYYEEDIFRMVYHNTLGLARKEEDYVVASRCMGIEDRELYLGLRCVIYDAEIGPAFDGVSIFELGYNFLSPESYSRNFSVRPIIKVEI